MALNVAICAAWEREKEREEIRRTIRELKSKNYIVIDSATTGLDDPEIIEIAITNKTSEVLFHSFVLRNHPYVVYDDEWEVDFLYQSANAHGVVTTKPFCP